MINFRKRGGEMGWENGKETKGPTKFGMGSRGLKPALCTTHSSYLGCLCTVYGPTYIVPNRLTISGPRNSYSTTKLFSSRTIYIYRPLHRFGLVERLIGSNCFDRRMYTRPRSRVLVFPIVRTTSMALRQHEDPSEASRLESIQCLVLSH